MISDTVKDVERIHDFLKTSRRKVPYESACVNIIVRCIVIAKDAPERQPFVVHFIVLTKISWGCLACQRGLKRLLNAIIRRLFAFGCARNLKIASPVYNVLSIFLGYV